MKSILNGQLIDEKNAVIPATDKGYFFDFAVYSSLKVIQGIPFFPEFHIDRLLFSANHIGLEHTFSKQDIATWFAQLIQENNLQDGLIRMLLIGDPDGKGNEKIFISTITGITYYPNKYYSQGIKTITYLGERRFPQAKTTDTFLSFMAKREATKAGAFEALLIDNTGAIREATSSNFFAVKDNTLYVPPKEHDLLGITKKIILDIAPSAFDIAEGPIMLSDIHTFDECFITSTLKNVMPIASIDDITFDASFEKTKLISNMYRDYYKKHVLGS